VVTQDANTKQVLMMAWMNAETLRMTLAEGRMVYYSRSRKEVWRKGDTSGDRQFVREGFYDCDVDTLLFLVEQEGNGACHTGAVSCFYRKFGEGAHDAH
jgi:phosphoribosyl-AMP cyclohydrolase/phosphoribosyl-ATP pyrophosphohydrolase/phosphoribosyl-AMP cyclohydrolase